MKKLTSFVIAHWKQALAFMVILVFMLCSVTILAKTFTNPKTYRQTIQSIDEKKVAVFGVSSAIAGTATILAAVTDDATTPLAEKMMDLNSYLIAVVGALVLEKSLLTVFGAVACYAIFPLACIFALIFIINKKQSFKTGAMKLTVLALAFLLVIPSAMKLSDYIYEINQISFEQEAAVIADVTETGQEDETTLPWYTKMWKSATEAIKRTAKKAQEYGERVLNQFIDAVAVFVIAYCAIPIFVVILFLWLFKILFGLKAETLNPKRLKSLTKKEEPEEILQ